MTKALATRYRILSLVAEGGTALLFLAQHSQLEGFFVVRILRPSLAHIPYAIAQFRRESHCGARLAGHPHILPIVDAGTCLGLPYHVTPYLEGNDLDYVLSRLGCLSFADTLLLASQVNDALRHACTLGFLHGDLSPGNIRLDRSGMFIVYDFGAVNAVSSEAGNLVTTRNNLYMATPLYVSPEQIRAEPTDIRADLYALGAILFEALTGAAAFAADSLAAIEGRHLRGDVDFSHTALQAHPDLRQLITRLLALHPADRPANPVAVQAALARMISPPLRVAAQLNKPPELYPRRRRLSSSSTFSPCRDNLD